MSQTRHSEIHFYLTYYHVTNLFSLHNMVNNQTPCVIMKVITDYDYITMLMIMITLHLEMAITIT